jgi:hypothetical protein
LALLFAPGVDVRDVTEQVAGDYSEATLFSCFACGSIDYRLTRFYVALWQHPRIAPTRPYEHYLDGISGFLPTPNHAARRDFSAHPETGFSSAFFCPDCHHV